MNKLLATGVAYLCCMAVAAAGAGAVAVVFHAVLILFGAASPVGLLAALAVGAGYGAFLFLVASSFIGPFRHAGGCAALMQGLGAALLLVMLVGAGPHFELTARAILPLLAAYLLAAGASLAVSASGILLPRFFPPAYAGAVLGTQDEIEQ